MPARPSPMTHEELGVAVRLAGSPRRLATVAWLPVSTVLAYAAGRSVPPRHARVFRALTSRDFLWARALPSEVDPGEVEIAERRRVVSSLIDRADELEARARGVSMRATDTNTNVGQVDRTCPQVQRSQPHITPSNKGVGCSDHLRSRGGIGSPDVTLARKDLLQAQPSRDDITSSDVALPRKELLTPSSRNLPLVAHARRARA